MPFFRWLYNISKNRVKQLVCWGVTDSSLAENLSGEEGDQEWESFANDKWCSHDRKQLPEVQLLWQTKAVKRKL